jgi:hypothetical protein
MRRAVLLHVALCCLLLGICSAQTVLGKLTVCVPPLLVACMSEVESPQQASSGGGIVLRGAQ